MNMNIITALLALACAALFAIYNQVKRIARQTDTKVHTRAYKVCDGLDVFSAFLLGVLAGGVCLYFVYRMVIQHQW
jgi:hypothetical protein